MSSPQSDGGARRGSEHPPRPPGEWLYFGVAYPAAAIAIALVSGIFHPIPTYWQALAMALVPASNLVVWTNLREGAPLGIKSLAFANGVAMAIAGFYALSTYFCAILGLVPLLAWNAVLAIIIGVCILPVPPIAAFVCTLRLRVALCERDTERTSFRSLLRGLAAGSAVLLVLYGSPAATWLGIPWTASNAGVSTTSTNVGRR